MLVHIFRLHGEQKVFIEGQVFSPCYYLAPPLTPLHPSPVSYIVVSLSQSSCVSPVQPIDGDGRGGEWGEGGARSYDVEKAMPSIKNNSILSDGLSYLYILKLAGGGGGVTKIPST